MMTHLLVQQELHLPRRLLLLRLHLPLHPVERLPVNDVDVEDVVVDLVDLEAVQALVQALVRLVLPAHLILLVLQVLDLVLVLPVLDLANVIVQAPAAPDLVHDLLALVLAHPALARQAQVLPAPALVLDLAAATVDPARPAVAVTAARTIRLLRADQRRIWKLFVTSEITRGRIAVLILDTQRIDITTVQDRIRAALLQARITSVNTRDTEALRNRAPVAVPVALPLIRQTLAAQVPALLAAVIAVQVAPAQDLETIAPAELAVKRIKVDAIHTIVVEAVVIVLPLAAHHPRAAVVAVRLAPVQAVLPIDVVMVNVVVVAVAQVLVLALALPIVHLVLAAHLVQVLAPVTDIATPRLDQANLYGLKCTWMTVQALALVPILAEDTKSTATEAIYVGERVTV